MRLTLSGAAAVLLAVAALAVGVADDGHVDDERDIRALVRDYSQATVTADGRRACSLMTPVSRAVLAGREQDCAESHRAFSTGADVRAAYRSVTVNRLEIDGSVAQVELSLSGEESPLTFALARRGDRWLLDFEAPGRAELIQEGHGASIDDRIASPGPTGR